MNEKILNEGNQFIKYTILHCVNFSGSIFYGSGMVINYGSGFAKVRYSKKLRFLRFKFRNTGENILRYLCCSSEWRGSSQAVRITLNRRHSLPDQSNGD